MCACREDVDVIGHEAIGWNDDAMAARGARQNVSKTRLIFRCQPSDFSFRDSHRPMNKSEATITFTTESREMAMGSFGHE